jgi:hypothetical protein
MQAQEIYDTVYKHLMGMNHRSMLGVRNCVYRAPDGSKCAVGALIADDEYDSDMEGESAQSLSVKGMLPVRLAEHVLLLGNLQSIHDSPFNWSEDDTGLSDDGIDRLNRIAAQHGLTVPA